MTDKFRETDMATDYDLLLLQRRLEEHEEQFREHVNQENERWNKLVSVQERNIESIIRLTDATQGVVEAWDAANGVIKAGAAVGQLVKWAAGFAVVGACITWAFNLA